MRKDHQTKGSTRGALKYSDLYKTNGSTVRLLKIIIQTCKFVLWPLLNSRYLCRKISNAH